MLLALGVHVQLQRVECALVRLPHQPRSEAGAQAGDAGSVGSDEALGGCQIGGQRIGCEVRRRGMAAACVCSAATAAELVPMEAVVGLPKGFVGHGYFVFRLGSILQPSIPLAACLSPHLLILKPVF